VLVAIGGAVALYSLLGPKGSARRENKPWMSVSRAVWMVPFAILLAGSLIFTISGTINRVQERMPGTTPPLGTLNAMDWMLFSTQPIEIAGNTGSVVFKYEREALDWLNATIKGTPVIAAAPVGYYRESGMMVGTYTGLPMVVGGLHQDEQRYGWLVGERRSDMDQFFTTPDINRALLILNKYDVEYIYLGEVERIRYAAESPEGLTKFDDMVADGYLETAFDKGNHVLVYHVVGAKVRASVGVDPGSPQVAPTPRPRPTEPALGDDPALNKLLQQSKADPNNVDFHRQLADYYRQHAAIDSAIAEYTEVVRLVPQDIAAQHSLGDLYAQQGDRDKALAVWEAATQNAAPADKPAAFNKVGIAYQERQRYDDAINAFKSAVAGDRQFAEGWVHLGEVYILKGDNDAAKAALNNAIQNARSDESGQHWKAEAQRKLDAIR
jgi:Tfp pilus assembly protein PilF